MATFYSTQMTNLRAVPSVKNPVETMHGKLRVARFGYAQVAASTALDGVDLVKLPAGRCRFIGALSYMRHNLTTGSQYLDLGWRAYVGLDGVAVVEDTDGLDDNVDVDTTGLITAFGTVTAVAAVGNMKVFESQTGVTICMIGVEIIDAADYVYGDIIYAMD